MTYTILSYDLEIILYLPVVLLTYCQVCKVSQATLLPLPSTQMCWLVFLVVVLDQLPPADSEVGVMESAKPLMSN